MLSLLLSLVFAGEAPRFSVKPAFTVERFYVVKPVARAAPMKTGYHVHHCPCGNSWGHYKDSYGKIEDHTCAKCGRVIWN